jgi:Na+/proline symporter
VAVLFPLVFANFHSIAEFTAALPTSFFRPIREPFTPLYVIAFYLLVLLSYNGNWAFAQKFYSVPDERAARKAGLLATALKVAGPPLFILPAMAARVLMPELGNPPNSPQYAYAALSLKYLPAGLMGLMIAAMFSATMSTLSGDYNVIASVLTQDVYHRFIHRNASEQRLVVVGRVSTVLVGIATVGIGAYLVHTANKGLFEVMVTLFGLFVGPMLIPMLAGLLNRRVTWRGAAAGMAAGFATGFAMFLWKTLVLSKRPDIDARWLRYDYEALSILANFGVTIAAMVLVSLFERVSAADRERIAQFFSRLDRPIGLLHDDVTAAGPAFSPFYIMGWITIGTGLMLWGAAAVQPSGVGRNINFFSGLVLETIGAALHILHRRIVSTPTVTGAAAPLEHESSAHHAQ